MPRLTRAKALQAMQAAGATNDRMAFTRLYVENRISRAFADEAWCKGVALRRFVEKRDAAKGQAS
jgi:hypothetical protein